MNDNFTFKPIKNVRGRDLYAHFDCVCLRWPESKSLKTKKEIRLVGYADSNFFDNVNKKPSEYTCECGHVTKYQWTLTGLKVW